MKIVYKMIASLLLIYSLIPTVCLSQPIVSNSNIKCPSDIVRNGDYESKVAEIAGNAILFPANSHVGTRFATTCLLKLFDGHEGDFADPAYAVSTALLSIMTIDPVRWFEAATSVDPRDIDVWLGRPIEYSQLQGTGVCRQPDRFMQAKLAIMSFQPEKQIQEKLRKRILGVLTKLKCETGY